MSELVVLRTYSDQMSAEVALGLLDSCDIEAHLFSDNAGGYIVGLSPGGPSFRLMVRETDQERAEEVLEAKVIEEPGAR